MKLKRLLKEVLNEKRFRETDPSSGVWFWYPATETFSGGNHVKTLNPYEFLPEDREAINEPGNSVLRVYDQEKAEKYQKKYGIPTVKEYKAIEYVIDALWDMKRNTPGKAYDKYNWYRYGNGIRADIGYVYSLKNGFEFYLKIPREIRHPEEYTWVPDEDIQMFDKITADLDKIANKVKSMGFKTSISSTPDGYK